MIKLLKNNKTIPFLFLRLFFLLAVFIGIVPFLLAQKTYKNFSYTTSENNTGIEKITTLYNQLYSFGYGGSELIFNYNEPSLMVSTPQKLFIAKYNDTGAYTKSISLGGNANNLNGGMTTLTNNLICVSGVFSAGYFEESNRISTNAKGIFITSLDSSLGFKWRLIFDGNKKFNCNLLCPDGKGNFYAAGFFTDSIVFGSAIYKAKNYKDSTDFRKDIFILHITQNGVILNSFTMGSYGNDYPTALTCDDDGNAILAATISDTVTLGNQIYEQQSKSRSVLFKISPTGKTFWITGLSGAGVYLNALSFNTKKEIICGASFNGGLIIKYKNSSEKITTDGLTNQIFIGAFDGSGKLLRFKTEGSDNATKLKALCLDKDDNIYISGTFQCTFTSYNKQNESFSFKNIGYDDIYLSAYSKNLAPLWQRHAGGPRVDNVTDLKWWQNRPTLSGNFSRVFYSSSDSIYPVINGYSIGYSRNYYNNNIYNGYYLDASATTKYSNGRDNQSGFISNLMDGKSPQLNYYFRTGLTSPKYTEKAAWDNDLYNYSDTFCYSTGVRSHWVMDGDPNQDKESRYNGPFIDYYLNGVKTNYHEIYYEPIITKTGNYKLDLKTIDGCYSESIQKTITILKSEYAEIGYDKTKLVNNQYIVICNKDSIILTATKTFGLKYFWVVENQDFVLDTGTINDTINKLIYRAIKKDTLYSKSIVVKKSAFVTLELEKNIACKESAYPLKIRKLYFDKNDSLVAYFTDSIEKICINGNNTSAYSSFKIKLFDKKTGFVKIVPFYLYSNINGLVHSNGGLMISDQKNQFSIKQSGLYKIDGYIDVGCGKKYFKIEKYYTLVKPKISFSGILSKCRDEEHIFIADSGFNKYNWYVSGAPVTPVITYINPWKIKVKGSLNYISVNGWLDSAKVVTYMGDTVIYYTCGALAEKRIDINYSSNIKSNTNPPIICPGKLITLSVDDGSNFLWYPTGEKTRQINTDVPGIYYCTYNDTAGCVIKSTSMELVESYKPDLLVQPDDGLCPGQNAEIFVIVPKYAPIIWQQPTSWGSSSHITTKNLGIVKCSTNVCNTPYILQANIALKQFNQSTLYRSDSICEGQSLNVASHDSETYMHKWSLIGNVVFKNSKIISYTTIKVVSNQKKYSINTDGIYLVEAKDLCDNWYKTDIFIIKKTNRPGVNKNYLKGICGADSFLFDLRNSNTPPLDSFNKCRWLNDNDTSFNKKISSITAQYQALITNKFCSSPDTVLLRVVNKTTPTIRLKGKTEVCIGESVQLNATVSDPTWSTQNILWNHNLGNGSNKIEIINLKTIYKVSITDTCGTNSDSLIIIPYSVKANFISEYDDILDKTLLTDKSIGNNIIQWNWLLDNKFLSDLQNTEILSPYKNNYLICLHVANTIGCRDSICKSLPIYIKGDFYIPNVFNPLSGISINSRFAPVSKLNLKYNLIIYSRWGEKLFEGGNETLGWDGTYKGAICQEGAYMYILKIEYFDPKGFYISKDLKGTLLLLR